MEEFKKAQGVKNFDFCFFTPQHMKSEIFISCLRLKDERDFNHRNEEKGQGGWVPYLAKKVVQCLWCLRGNKTIQQLIARTIR